MIPIDFPESNRNLLPPKDWPGEEPCWDLPVWSDGKVCLSCWRMSWGERLKALVFGRAWVYVHSGHTQPPVAVAKSVFKHHCPSKESRT